MLKVQAAEPSDEFSSVFTSYLSKFPYDFMKLTSTNEFEQKST